MNPQTRSSLALLALLACGIALLSIQQTEALPGGATITSASTAGTPTQVPDSRADPRGTITTVIINGIQQDQNWKGYVGNVTGKLSLDDANSFTIYDWSITVNKIGEVYLSRSSSPVFASVSCANTINITAEEVFNNMTSAQSDNINHTFIATFHQSFFVGTQQIAANTCRSTATYRNDTSQAADVNQTFQEVVLQDNSSNVMFVTMINSSTTGFDNRQYDFQMIVPESAVKASPTSYYFFTELG